VHDEIVVEIDTLDLALGKSLSEFVELLSETPAWLGDCPLKVKGWQGRRYRK